MGQDDVINSGSLAGKVALITGGARRVGAQLVRRLHAAGANVLIHYRASGADAERLQAELQAARPDSVQLLQANLLAHDELLTLAERAITRWECFGVLPNADRRGIGAAMGGIVGQ